MAEQTTVAFRVDESAKAKWEDAVESPEYHSLSHLIRLSVQKEITGSEGTDTQPDNTPAENSEVLDSLTRLERTVDDIQDELDAVSRENRSEELFDLEQVLLEVLPTAPETYSPGPDEPEAEEVGQKPREVAGRIGADSSDVSEALEGLANTTGQVRSFQNYYWRVN
jgi:Arc/MetJ-type ribon-helix-helix transcriptional regulator